MGGGPYYVEMPEVVNVHLEGELPEWATARTWRSTCSAS